MMQLTETGDVIREFDESNRDVLIARRLEIHLMKESSREF